MIRGTPLSQSTSSPPPKIEAQGREAILSAYVKCLTSPTLGCNINRHLFQLVVEHVAIMVGYIIRVGPSLSPLTHGGFVGGGSEMRQRRRVYQASVSGNLN